VTKGRSQSRTFSMNDLASRLILTNSTWSHARCGPSWRSIGIAISTRSTYVFACFTCGMVETGCRLFNTIFGSPLKLHQHYNNTAVFLLLTTTHCTLLHTTYQITINTTPSYFVFHLTALFFQSYSRLRKCFHAWYKSGKTLHTNLI